MAEVKKYLDQAGVEHLVKLIRDEHNESINSLGKLAKLDEINLDDLSSDLVALLNGNADGVSELKAGLEKLNGDKETEGSVAKQVADAINDLVNGAPEALDTLKEIADWIANDETGVQQIIDDVAKNKEDIAANKEAIEELANIKDYIDAQDQLYFDSIQSISDEAIDILFRKEVKLEDKAITELQPDEVLVLNNSDVISEDLVIPSGAAIRANGAEFTGNVTIPEDAIIDGAIFSGKVVIG